MNAAFLLDIYCALTVATAAAVAFSYIYLDGMNR